MSDPENTIIKKDFDCTYTDCLPELLGELGISVAFTSYQASRLMLVRTDGEEIDINFKHFPRPMGLSYTGSELTLGTFSQIINFKREDALLPQIKDDLAPIEQDITAPRAKSKHEQNKEEAVPLELTDEQRAQIEQQNQQIKQRQAQLHKAVDPRTDSCFITRSSHYSGMINIHDIAWGNGQLWAVNSSFSCLCTFNPDYSFEPYWKPYFISQLEPEDRCHLNGMTLRDGKPAFVTTFSTFDEPGKWRDGDKFNGTLMSVAENRILVDGLAMPHSPRWYNDKVYFCNSGHGEVKTYCEKTQSVDTLIELPGFTRGVDFYGSLMVVGLSKVRQSDVTKPAPLAKKYDETYSGLAFINLDTNELIGLLSFTGNVDQVYDVAIIHDSTFPEIIEPSNPRLRNHFTYPSSTHL
ncbi:MAG: TIGR03032 family protein [Glaciecola sp.]|nr:TIGR03032 family protein [Glaciecola sp.]